MRTKSILFTSVLTIVLVSASLATEVYRIDQSHSSVNFSVKHLVISNTKGQFEDFTGVIHYNPENHSESSVEVTINAASIDSDDQERDKHLRSADFLDVEKYPRITFKSKTIKETDDGFVAIGDLTIRDVTKEVQIPFSLSGPISDPWGNKRLGAEGHLTIDRQDFGVSWNKTLDNGGLVVGNDVKINLEVEAIKAKEGTN